MKKILSMHDISTLGRCSQTLCIPLLSSFNLQVCPFITSVLSATTSYENYEFIDLSSALPLFIKKWRENGEKFDIFYSGFLGSRDQQKVVEELLNSFEFKRILIDPVFADNGQIYNCFDESIIEGFRKIINLAHIITPNVSEFKFLFNIKMETILNEELIRSIIIKNNLKAEYIIITSFEEDNLIGALCYVNSKDTFIKVMREKIEKNYPGSGELFACLLISFLEKDLEMGEALEKTCDGILKVIKHSSLREYPQKEGLLIEDFLSNKF